MKNLAEATAFRNVSINSGETQFKFKERSMLSRRAICIRFVLPIAMLVVAFPNMPAANARPKFEKKSEILGRLSVYKSWKRVNRLDDDVTSGTFKIEDSSPGG